MLITPLQAAVYKAISIKPETSDVLPVVTEGSSFLSQFDNSPLVTGLFFYIGGFAFLTIWESFVVPVLQLNSILPDIPLIGGQLTQKEKAVPWITPLTANLQTPPPNNKELKIRGKYIIGVQGEVQQFITLEKKDLQKGVYEYSKEWSEYYKDEVFVFKKRAI